MLCQRRILKGYVASISLHLRRVGKCQTYGIEAYNRQAIEQTAPAATPTPVTPPPPPSHSPVTPPPPRHPHPSPHPWTNGQYIANICECFQCHMPNAIYVDQTDVNTNVRSRAPVTSFISCLQSQILINVGLFLASYAYILRAINWWFYKYHLHLSLYVCLLLWKQPKNVIKTLYKTTPKPFIL